jgi:hypothetical protein
VGVTSHLAGVTSEPVSVTSEPVSVTSEPVSVTSEPVSVTSQPVSVTSEPVGVTSQWVDGTIHSISAIAPTVRRTVKRSALPVACYAPSPQETRDVQLGTAVYKKDYSALLNTLGGETFSFLMNLKE